MSITRQERIEKYVADLNLPSYVIDQINQAICKNGITEYSQITNISKFMRDLLTNELGPVSTLTKISESSDDQTQKILFETRDGHRIESVRMTYLPNRDHEEAHNALCISCQSGCAMGCKFCATGAMGFQKNLSADEIVDQLLYFKQNKIEIDTIFFSGMGEPLANPDIFVALDMLINKEYFGMGSRKISLSTVGIVPGIKQLTEQFPQVNLAFSLHSPFPDQRLYLMPVTKAYPIDAVMAALDAHIAKTNRKVFLAYTLMGDTNDSVIHAKALVNIIKKKDRKSYLYHVNLIRYHPASSKEEFQKPDENNVQEFYKILKTHGIQVTIRQSFGLDLNAACGQLNANYVKTLHGQ